MRSSNQYNVILDDVVMLHCLEELTNANIFVRFLQYTRALKTWETHHIHLGPDSITSETVSTYILYYGYFEAVHTIHIKEYLPYG